MTNLQIPILNSRNFSSRDIARSALSVPQDQYYATAYLHGYLQAVRDAASRRFGGAFRGLGVTSSNRATYNGSVAGAAANSYHIFGRRDKGNLKSQIVCAADVKPYGITLDQFYNFTWQTFKGEIYLNRPEDIVHIAPVAFEDEHFIKG